MLSFCCRYCYNYILNFLKIYYVQIFIKRDFRILWFVLNYIISFTLAYRFRFIELTFINSICLALYFDNRGIGYFGKGMDDWYCCIITATPLAIMMRHLIAEDDYTFIELDLMQFFGMLGCVISCRFC